MALSAPICPRCNKVAGRRTSPWALAAQTKFYCTDCGQHFTVQPPPASALDATQAYTYLRDQLRLAPGPAQAVLKQLKQQDQAARAAGAVTGGQGWTVTALEAAVQAFRIAKRARHADQLAYSAALALATGQPEAQPQLTRLVAEMNRQETALEAVRAERRTTGVTFAGRNVRARAAAMRQDIQRLKDEITEAGRRLTPPPASRPA